MVNDAGKPVEGVMTPDNTVWRPTVPLGYGRTYTLTVASRGPGGIPRTQVSSFTTLQPPNQTKVSFTTTSEAPRHDGAGYGVGTVVVAHFDEQVSDRAAAERHLSVTTRLSVRETINYATRISTDGIYLHELDSTVWAQGHTDTSHGCLNLNADNAKWFYDFSVPGDVVEIRHTGGPPLQLAQNGDWTVPWSQWTKGSALKSG